MTKLELATDLLIKSCEGIRMHAYPDSTGLLTIGIGTTHYPDGSVVKKTDTCTVQEAYDYLNDHLSKHVYPVVDALCDQYEIPDLVYAALCSFAYNLGTGFFTHTSFITPLAAQNWGTFDTDNLTGTGLAATFLQYDKATVDGQLVFIKGLQNRRIIEIKYMLGIN